MSPWYLQIVSRFSEDTQKYPNIHRDVCPAMLASFYWCSLGCLLASDFCAFWDLLDWNQNTVRVVRDLLVHWFSLAKMVNKRVMI